MSDPKQHLADWRAEISTELDEARKALAAAEEEHTATVAAAAIAGSTHLDLRTTLKEITNRRPGYASVTLAGPLALRFDEHKRAAAAADSRKASAHGACQELTRRISELERAIGQIDQLTAPAADTEEAA